MLTEECTLRDFGVLRAKMLAERPTVDELVWQDEQVRGKIHGLGFGVDLAAYTE